jgi:cob(I)alamin adenosyltransferase
MDERELQQTYDLNSKNLLTAVETAREGKCDLLILDEILGALSCDLIDSDLLRSLVEKKPEALELVLTGRNPPQWLLDHADYVTEMVKRKHPFDQGIPARKGIEL